MRYLPLLLLIALAGCTRTEHAAQRLADATAHTELAQQAIAGGRLDAAGIHLRAAQIQQGAALGALGYRYDPAAAALVPAPTQDTP